MALPLLPFWTIAAEQPRQVNDQLLRTGSKTGEEWVSCNVNWKEQRYSLLDQITGENTGVLYSITPWSIVHAVDLHTGRELWRADPGSRRGSGSTGGPGTHR